MDSQELRRLRAWKHEALIVLKEWDEAWEAAGSPGDLGSSMAVSTTDEIKRLRTENENLRAYASGLSFKGKWQVMEQSAAVEG